jgi:iron complex outermembrane receptor protein
MASLVSTFTKNGWNVALNNRFQGRLFANDSNEVEEKAFLVSNLNLSYRIEQEKLVWVPFFGVNNLWNTIYNDNIRVNAFGGRYYEPAPSRHIFGGVRLTL